ncbi:GNAT family N-acetyltransferase [Candidatus Haliotispira prima]|uniref:GNAT family N-acetyltransferase n=1 Tax=Candidatus Haliotispira prima TaxID=3034016 RepID=A0ABY8MI64_9SPIO|nr:GNAT family N-acetyltransferase [Candidatus Haliotispira prima]
MDVRPNTIEIRRLTTGDLRLFRQLNQLFGKVFAEAHTYQDLAPGDAYLAGLLEKPQIIPLVALHGSELVGGLVAYVLEKFEQERSEVYIYDLAVAEPFRRQKIATRLIEALKPEARNCGAWMIFVQADYGDEVPISLYRSLATQERVCHFDIPVGPAKQGPLI